MSQRLSDHQRHRFNIRSAAIAAWLLGTLLFACSTIGVHSSAFAFDKGNEQSTVSAPADASQALRARIRKAIAELDAPTYGQRRAAYLELLRIGPDAIDAVREATKSENSRIATTAATIESMLLLPSSAQKHQGTGRDAMQLMEEPTLEKIVRLCELGYWETAIELFETNPELKSGTGREGNFGGALGIEIASHLHRVSKAALAQGQPRLAWPILRLFKTRDTAPYQQGDLSLKLASVLNIELAKDQLRSQDALAEWDWYQGKIESARERDVSDRLRRVLLTRTADWSRLKETEPQQLLLGSLGAPTRQLASGMLFEFAGELDRANDIWEKAIGHRVYDEVVNGAPATSTVASNREARQEELHAAIRELLENAPVREQNQMVLCSLAAGQAEPVIDFIYQSNPNSGVEFLFSRNQYDRAFAKLGLDEDLSNFPAWLEQQESLLTAEGAKSIQQTNSPLFRQASHVCSVLVSLGYRSEAEELFDVIATAAQTHERLWRYSALRWLTSGEARIVPLERIDPFFRKLRDSAKSAVLDALFSEITNCSKTLLRTVPELTPRGEKRPNPFIALDRLQNFDSEFFVAHGASAEAWISNAFRAVMSENSRSPASRVAPALELAELARGCGAGALAQQISLADLGLRPGIDSPKHFSVAANMMAEAGDHESAAELWEQIRTARITSDDPLSRMKETEALRAAGFHEKANQVDDQRWLAARTARLFAGPTYLSLVYDLRADGDLATAKEYAELSTQLSEYGSIGFYWSTAILSSLAEEEDQLLESADTLRASLVEALLPGTNQLAYQVADGRLHALNSTIKTERIHRAATCIEAGQFEDADRHIAVGQSLHPQDIEMVVQCYPRLVAQGDMERANRLFDSYETTMLKQLERWPNDAMANNNLAWMYSQCDRKLEEAMRLAEKAVSLAPNSAVYLDTLAEVHYRSGRLTPAMLTMRNCIRLDPRDPHFQQNLLRFASGER
ncbi:MAG: hypothetical protein AAGG44_13895 [Planctomycetota bacterium]